MLAGDGQYDEGLNSGPDKSLNTITSYSFVRRPKANLTQLRRSGMADHHLDTRNTDTADKVLGLCTRLQLSDSTLGLTVARNISPGTSFIAVFQR